MAAPTSSTVLPGLSHPKYHIAVYRGHLWYFAVHIYAEHQPDRRQGHSSAPDALIDRCHLDAPIHLAPDPLRLHPPQVTDPRLAGRREDRDGHVVVRLVRLARQVNGIAGHCVSPDCDWRLGVGRWRLAAMLDECELGGCCVDAQYPYRPLSYWDCGRWRCSKLYSLCRSPCGLALSRQR